MVVGHLAGVHVRKRKRFYVLFFGLIISIVCLLKFSAALFESHTSNKIIEQLHTKYILNGIKEPFWDDDICVEYFDSLYAFDTDWKIRDFFHNYSWFQWSEGIFDSVTHLRVYGHCFVSNAVSVPALKMEDIETRLFPMFTKKIPVFTRWDGFSPDEFPILSNLPKDNIEHASRIEGSPTGSFWRTAKERYNGRGIVISVSDGIRVNEVKSLMRTLRLLKNRLPIQVVHKGDLSDYSIGEIVNTGRAKLSIEIGGEDLDVEYPQEVWFVNAGNCITQESLRLFQRFNNKWIASLFNSFEEMILMDTDVAPVVNPAELFETKEYLDNGAHFFRDRLLNEYTKRSSVHLFKNLMVSDKEYELFRFPRVSRVTLQNPFFKVRSKHVMESGVVTINRSKNLPGLLIATVLQLWQPTSEPFHGDKELFWLGQSISGNEEYQFNRYAGSAIGTLEHNDHEDSVHVCSTQIGHFDENFRLLWVNGGLKTCKFPSSGYDYSKNKALRRVFQSADDLKKHYESAIVIDGALVPMYPLDIKKVQGSMFKQNYDLGCLGYFWCASNSPGTPNVKTVSFNEEQIGSMRRIIKVWNIN